MEIKIVSDKISKNELKDFAQKTFGDFVKIVVDIAKEIMTVGGGLHADGEAVLLQQGSKQEDLWGANIYPEKSTEEWLVFDSMINIRPLQSNRSRNIENQDTREKIKQIIAKLTT